MRRIDWSPLLASPAEAAQRGSQICLAFDEASEAGREARRNSAAYAVVQALIARGVVGDFRAGDPVAASAAGRADILRFGVTPLYTRFVDVWDAVEHLRAVLADGQWREARFNQRGLVT